MQGTIRQFSFISLIILISIFFSGESFGFSDGTIGGGDPNISTTRIDDSRLISGNIEISGEVLPGASQVLLRGETFFEGANWNTPITVVLPVEVFAAGGVLDQSTLPMAVGENVALSAKEYEIDPNKGGGGIFAQGYVDKRTGNILNYPTNRATITILMLEANDNEVKAKLHYMFDGPGSTRQVLFSELTFLASTEGLKGNWIGSTTATFPLELTTNEEALKISIAGNGLGRGKANLEISPVALSLGRILDYEKIADGETVAACAKDVPFTVSSGETSQERRADFKVTLQKSSDDPNNFQATLEYDFNFTKPVEELNLSLKSEDLKACNVALAVNLPARMEWTAQIEEPSLGDPVFAPGDSAPGDGDSPGLGEPMPPADEGGIRPGVDGEIDDSGREPAATVSDSDTVFRPEHFVNEERGDANSASGAGVSGGSGGFISCTMQGVGSSSTDFWNLLALALGTLPLLRRRA